MNSLLPVGFFVAGCVGTWQNDNLLADSGRPVAGGGAGAARKTDVILAVTACAECRECKCIIPKPTMGLASLHRQ